MEVLYLHIGTHKTGTTSLQTFFRDNSALLKKKGIVYPKTGRARMGAHHHLISAISVPPHPEFKPKKSFTDYIAELNNEVAEDARCLISTEILNEIIDFSRLELFKTVAKKVKIIVYLRRQDHFLESGYSFEVRRGYTMSFAHYCTEWSLNYADLCGRYADIFGKENIIVRPYEKRQFHGGDIFSDFLDVLGLELTDAYRLPRKNPNPSLSRDALEYMYCINRLPLTKEEVLAFSPIILAFSGRAGKDAIFLPHDMLSHRERAALMAPYLEGNEEVAREYLGRTDGKLFYEPLGGSDETDAPYPGLTDERVTDITRFILDRSKFAVMVLKDGIRAGLASDEPGEYQSAKTLSVALKCKPFFLERSTVSFLRYVNRKKQNAKEVIKRCVVKLLNR